MESVSKWLLTDAEKDSFIATLTPHLAILRTQAGVSQEELANLIGVSRQTYSSIEKRMVLAHEEGHIYCNHLTSTPILGRDVIEEHEANEFAHYLLNPSRFSKIKHLLHRNRKKLLISMIGLALLTVAVVALCYTSKQQSYYGEYYITESGNKYHEKDCIFVKDKTSVHRMTEEEFESGEYEPCRICLP